MSRESGAITFNSKVIFVIIFVVAFAFSMPEASMAYPKKPGRVGSIKILSVTYNSVSLKWKKTKRAKAYIVYRSTKKNGYYKKLKKTTKTTYTDTRLKTGKKYWYKVRATNGARKGKFSRRKSAVPKMMNPVEGAIVWARNIAADDSFAYGTGKKAHKRGCYFCGTNKRFKPVGYEKTYCCNPFIFAAYAHGARDPKILASCQKGGCGGMEPSDWTCFGCFVTVGKTKAVPYTSLKAGDVIISQKSAGGPYEHVWMFCGYDEYVEASGEGWGSGTIAVKQNAAKNYKKYQTNGCYVMRYIGPR